MGIDVSKNTLDISLVVEGKTIFYQQINNTVKNIKTVINQCLDQNEANFNDTVFCMEHTGIYNLPLAKWLQEQQAKIWMESGVQIRKSLGMIRGKTDKIDSERIAQYAYTHKHKLNIWQAPRAVIKNISTLLAQRSRLIKCKKQLSVPINEQQDFIDKPIAKQLAYSTAKVVASLDKQLQVTETQIMEIVKSDDNINRLYKIITSVDGIGFVTAMYIITTTNEFIYIDNAKKYACYSGVVPFEHSSCTSISTKHRVSPMANKGIKKLLHLAALSAMQSNEELKHYYQRKLAAGKNKMSVINAIRNKLILSIFACVQNNRTFEKNYTYTLFKIF